MNVFDWDHLNEDGGQWRAGGHGQETLGSIKGRISVEQLSDCQLLKRNLLQGVGLLGTADHYHITNSTPY
jgi:hypothetical protein